METKSATTIKQQIDKLRKRGLHIKDESKASEILSDIGYYRLGFYWFPFEKGYPRLKNRTHEFIAGADFDTAVKLYYFDNDLRNILTQYLHRIEIHLRTTLIYIVSNHYKNNPTWFSDPRIVNKEFIDKLPGLYSDIRKNNAIKHHHNKYHNDIYAPAWKTLEYMTFGGILYLINNLKDIPLQEEIAKAIGITNLTVFRSQMQVLRNLRNICAHGHNLFDLHLDRPIKLGRLRGVSVSQRSNVSGAVIVLADILGNLSINRKTELIHRVNSLLDSTIGTPIEKVICHIAKLSL